MPQGKHKGARVVLTVDQEQYARWKEYAAALEMPVATVMRDALTMFEPAMGEVALSFKELKNADEKEIDEFMGKMMWKMFQTNLKQG